LNINNLNNVYSKLSLKQRIFRLYEDFDVDEIMLTSSFAASSAMLLKLFSDINKNQLIYFIDTRYHFNETLIYKEYLTKLYGLRVKDVKAEEKKHNETKINKTWIKDPNSCCNVNKVNPLEKLKSNYKIWVSGLMKWQSDNRSTLNFFEQRNGIVKFYPLLDVSQEERNLFIKEHHLPFHPLISKGYYSIGCEQCTQPGEGREGRWNNNPKTECGLHL
jgi:phosphoadenosine phosphosulfate reductase